MLQLLVAGDVDNAHEDEGENNYNRQNHLTALGKRRMRRAGHRHLVRNPAGHTDVAGNLAVSVRPEVARRCAALPHQPLALNLAGVAANRTRKANFTLVVVRRAAANLALHGRLELLAVEALRRLLAALVGHLAAQQALVAVRVRRVPRLVVAGAGVYAPDALAQRLPQRTEVEVERHPDPVPVAVQNKVKRGALRLDHHVVDAQVVLAEVEVEPGGSLVPRKHHLLRLALVLSHHYQPAVVTKLVNERALVRLNPRQPAVPTQEGVHLRGVKPQVVADVPRREHEPRSLLHGVKGRKVLVLRDSVQVQETLALLTVVGLALRVHLGGLQVVPLGALVEGDHGAHVGLNLRVRHVPAALLVKLALGPVHLRHELALGVENPPRVIPEVGDVHTIQRVNLVEFALPRRRPDVVRQRQRVPQPLCVRNVHVAHLDVAAFVVVAHVDDHRPLRGVQDRVAPLLQVLRQYRPVEGRRVVRTHVEIDRLPAAVGHLGDEDVVARHQKLVAALHDDGGASPEVVRVHEADVVVPPVLLRLVPRLEGVPAVVDAVLRLGRGVAPAELRDVLRNAVERAAHVPRDEYRVDAVLIALRGEARALPGAEQRPRGLHRVEDPHVHRALIADRHEAVSRVPRYEMLLAITEDDDHISVCLADHDRVNPVVVVARTAVEEVRNFRPLLSSICRAVESSALRLEQNGRVVVSTPHEVVHQTVEADLGD
ncbi:bifunctional acetaldehyde-CoA/alcohol dehydrogenase [Babesia caballi]|uniref:Bifunctional acetaldehyde-CoA/alcohol dehydrogenase n=1 Tax=Babesia caballi TaxID=5871 RepID=A0AAV4LW89_BABCB|nr:bifunctional acetaldehyde-CoA/alcohol dehydrogenase [Babesia caballi]